MGNYRMPRSLGMDLNVMAKRAQALSKERMLPVEFDMNGILCVVDKDSDLRNISKHYLGADAKKLKVIGPVYNK